MTEEEYIEDVEKWQAEGKASQLRFAVINKAFAVRVANLLRKEGYTVEVHGSNGHYFTLIYVNRKKL